MATDFQKKKKTGRIHHLVIAVSAIAVLALCVVLIGANVNIYRKKQQLNANIESLKTQITNLQKENSDIQEGITNADNGQYIEKVAREQLDLQKPGETVVSFVQSQPQTQPQQQQNSKNILQVWMGWVSGWFKQ